MKKQLSNYAITAEHRGDTNSHYQNTLYTGDVTERIKVLKSVGQRGLAYLCAKTHGLEEEAEAIAASLPPDQVIIMLILHFNVFRSTFNQILVNLSLDAE